MRFIATSNYGAVITDNYTNEEIKKGIHIKNIIEDFKQGMKVSYMYIKVFDENNNFVKQIYLQNS